MIRNAIIIIIHPQSKRESRVRKLYRKKQTNKSACSNANELHQPTNPEHYRYHRNYRKSIHPSNWTNPAVWHGDSCTFVY